MDEKSTDQLSKILTSTHSPKGLEQYIICHTQPDAAFSFHTAFDQLLQQHALKKSEVICRSGLERTYGYQLLNGRKQPGRDKILALGIAAGLSLQEVQQLLKRSKAGILYPRSSRDAVLIYGIEHHLDVIRVNEMLADIGERLLEL